MRSSSASSSSFRAAGALTDVIGRSAEDIPGDSPRGAESARFFMRLPPINNLDLSVSKNISFPGGVKAEVRLDMFNALNHTQFTGVNSTVNFASLTDRTITNLPYDASGNLVRQNGFGTISGVAPPRTLQLVTRLTF